MATIVFTSCHFVSERNDGITYYQEAVRCGEIDLLLKCAQKSRTNGIDCDDWLDQYDDRYLLNKRDNWDEIIGEIYAIKSICQVSHSPVYYVSEEFLSLGFEGGFKHGIPFILFGVLSIPIDIIQLPIQFSVKTVNHISVSRKKLIGALNDLSSARKYGFVNSFHHSGSMMTPRYYYLDHLGHTLE